VLNVVAPAAQPEEFNKAVYSCRGRKTKEILNVVSNSKFDDITQQGSETRSTFRVQE